MKKLRPTFDAVIVKPLEEEETTHGNIIVPDLGKEKNQQGEIIAIGPGKHTVTGQFLKTVLEVGDRVLLPTMGFTKFDFEGEEYYVGPENSILSVILD
jgi:chaperonin GroES